LTKQESYWQWNHPEEAALALDPHGRRGKVEVGAGPQTGKPMRRTF
jgi:hypothetical protein